MVLLERAQHVWSASVSGPPVPARSDEPSVLDVGRIWHIGLALLPFAALAGFWRLWQQAYGFSNGLDATMPHFDLYWMTIFYFNIGVLPVIVAGVYGWLILSGEKAARTPLTPAEEARRIWRLWLIVAAFAEAAYLGGSYFAEQDAAWHQVTLRDTAFTPSHIGLFYGAFPLMIYAAFGAYLYARTRLPHLFGVKVGEPEGSGGGPKGEGGGKGAGGGKGGAALPVSFALVIGGTVLLMFQVAFNEFGHTFWQTEEVFSAPLHWPFVIFAYLLFATFAIWFASAIRLGQLVRQEVERS